MFWCSTFNVEWNHGKLNKQIFLCQLGEVLAKPALMETSLTWTGIPKPLSYHKQKNRKESKASEKGATDVEMTEKHPVLAINATNQFVVNIQKKRKYTNILNQTSRL